MSDVAAPVFEPDALREKYREQRDKRLRPDGNDQYVEIAGRYAHYAEDPYVAPITRQPIDEELDVVVIGGGFGGLLAGARLREVGVDDLRLIEKGGDVGGTWYWNRYPGAACDVESYIYLPLLEEIGSVPQEKYSHAPEILAHSQAIARHFDLYRGALFQTEVSELRWDDDAGRWLVTTNRGDRLAARFVVMASGPLHRPKLPGVPGLDDFQGHTFHTSRWDYAYTGGDADGNLTGLAGKRVGIIGTGATAVQCVPPSPPRPSSSTCSSGRPRRSTCGPTARPTRTGRPACDRGGSNTGWTTSTRWSPAGWPTRTSSTTAGPTSSATC